MAESSKDLQVLQTPLGAETMRVPTGCLLRQLVPKLRLARAQSGLPSAGILSGASHSRRHCSKDMQFREVGGMLHVVASNQHQNTIKPYHRSHFRSWATWAIWIAWIAVAVLWMKANLTGSPFEAMVGITTSLCVLLACLWKCKRRCQSTSQLTGSDCPDATANSLPAVSPDPEPSCPPSLPVQLFAQNLSLEPCTVGHSAAKRQNTVMALQG